MSFDILCSLKAFSKSYGFSSAAFTVFATLGFSFLTWWLFYSAPCLHSRSAKKPPAPPGSLGLLPFLGETLDFLRLSRAGRLQEFIGTRLSKHGPIFKTSLFGCPTLVDVSGMPLNKFLFANENKLVIDRWPKSLITLLGDRSVLTVHGAAHKRIRLAFASFLGPDSLLKFVQSTEATVLRFFADHFDAGMSVPCKDVGSTLVPPCEADHTDTCTVASAARKEKHLCIYPLMRNFAFTIACSFLLSLHDCAHVARLYSLFFVVNKGLFSIPVSLPGTRYRAGLIARKALDRELQLILNKRKLDLQDGVASPDQDALSCLITEKDANGKPLLSDIEIKDNLVTLFSGAHETSPTSLAMIFKFLAENPAHAQLVIKEQNEIAATKKLGEGLNWHDVQMMKFALKFIQETLRILPPLEFAFREVLKEFDYNGYTIPRGWKVLWLPFCSHMKPEVFQEPHLFDPSHFVGSGPPPFSFVPFGGGARLCPGMEFSKMYMLIFVHHLVRKYQWELVIPNEPIVSDPLPRPKQGLPVRIMSL